MRSINDSNISAVPYTREEDDDAGLVSSVKKDISPSKRLQGFGDVPDFSACIENAINGGRKQSVRLTLYL